MKLRVNKDACIGCRACVATCPNVFDLNDEGYAYVLVDEIIESDQDKAIEALENCPTNAIERIEEND